jgi:hypothetical protein
MPEQRLGYGRSTRNENQIVRSHQNKRRHTHRKRRSSRSTHRDIFSRDTWQVFARNLGEFLAEVGCCLPFPILVIGGIGTMSGLLIWHSVLRGMLTGGGAALVALIAFVVLALSSRKEGEAHGSQTNTSVGNSAGGA